MPVFELLRENETRLYENDETKQKKIFVVSVRINVTEHLMLVCKKEFSFHPHYCRYFRCRHIYILDALVE